MFQSLRSAFRKNPAAAERFFSYAQILLGALIGGAAYPLFMTPNRIAPGGITGVATILNHLLHWPVGTVSLVLNLPLFMISYKAMGKIFAFRSLVATIAFSLFIDILPLKPMTNDPLLGALYGGVLLGIGLGLIMRGGATTGGSDMIARMVHKRFPFISTGAFLFAIDFAVVLAAGLLIGTSEALYALINIFLTAKVMDMSSLFTPVFRSFISCSITSEYMARKLSIIGSTRAQNSSSFDSRSFFDVPKSAPPKNPAKQQSPARRPNRRKARAVL